MKDMKDIDGSYDGYDELYDQITRKKNYRTWSPSSTKVFLSCRLKYFFQYVKGWRIRSKSPALSLGTSFHAAAEELNRAEAFGRTIEVNDLFSEFDTVWEREISAMVEGEHYKTQKELDGNRQKGLDLVEKHVNSRIRKAYKPAVYTPPYSTVLTPAVELKMDVPLINMKTGRVLNESHHITGFIDVVSVAEKATSHFEPGDLMVLDYKTAAREWDQFSVDTNLQLLMYAYAMRYVLRHENWFSHLRKDKEDLVGIVCLVKQKASRDSKKYGKVKNYIIRITDPEIEFLERMLMNCIQELEGCGDLVENFIPNPSPDNCRYCDYKNPCLLVRRGAGTPDILDWGAENGFLRKG